MTCGNRIKCGNGICICCCNMYLKLQTRQACVHNLNTNEVWKSNLHLLLRHILIIANLNEAKCFTNKNEIWSQSCISQTASHQLTASSIRSCSNLSLCFTYLSAADKRVSTIWTQMKCWHRICIYCYDMYLQLQNWMKLNVSRVSQLPTRMCPEFKHKSNVDLESASIATTYTYNCKIEWS